MGNARKAFKKIKIPKTLQLTKQENIVDLPKCIESHLRIIEGSSSNKAKAPYVNRLRNIYKKLTND